QEGTETDEIYIVKSGLFQISKFSIGGKELTLRLCAENTLIGELTLFTSSPRLLFNAKALEDSEVYVVKNETLEKELFRNQKLGQEFMKWMSDHVRKQHTKFRDLVLKGKKGALYSTLIRMTNTYGVKREDGILIDIPLTNQELANYSGTSREAVNRMLSELKKQDILSIENKKIVIHNLRYLKKENECDSCEVAYCTID